MRHLDDSIWRDEWFAEQEVMGRLLWIGIITHAADDQGRFLDNAALVKSDVFPMDRNDADEIELWLTKFCSDGKLIRYEAGGKRLMQVANWWKYQGGATWMAKSKYQAPEGWTDFYRFHAKGDRSKIEVSPSWPLRNSLPSEVGTQVGSEVPSGDINNDIDLDIDNDSNKEQEGAPISKIAKTPAAPAAASQYFVNAGQGDAYKTLLQASELAMIPRDEESRLDGVASLITAYGQDKCLEALVEARKNWVKTPKKTGGGGNYSVLNFAWVDWASEYLATGVKRWEENRKGKNNGNSNNPGRNQGQQKPVITEAAREQARRVLARQREREQAAAPS